MFEAQLTALEIADDKRRATLVCLLEGNAFSKASQFIATNGVGTTYVQLRAELQRLFGGEDYRRALEAKIRTLVFSQDVNIPDFCNNLRVTVAELFGINDSPTIEKLAINDVMSKLDPKIREDMKVLQLAGTCTLEAILELAKSKMVENTLTNTFGASTMSESNRLDKLEKMMEKIVSHMAATNVQRGQSLRSCEECGKSNHDTRFCWKRKTCFVCQELGHISRFFPKKPTGSAGIECSDGPEVTLQPAARIMLSVGLNNETFEFLYDPGSEYSIITKATYDSLKHKPVLESTHRIGLSVQKVPFKMDGIVHLTCQFYDVAGNVFNLANEPFLVSEAIDTNIFGMHTEQRFRTIRRDHVDGLMTFSTYKGDEINVKFFREKHAINSNLSYVRVMKVTIVQPRSYSFVKSKVVNPATNKGETLLFNGAKDNNFLIPDLIVNDLVSRNILIPVVNSTDENMSETRNLFG